MQLIMQMFPFMLWFKGYKVTEFRADFIAGVTVALVLIPQSMAYAQLAGLPAFYGLYAAFLPPMVAALFGSSRQLATGPVAVVSLMTAAALEPLATAGSEPFIAYAVLMALVVGLFQFTLGLLRLGVIVNFLSHPVVNGFTNAAALIIGTSQLSKLFGVYVDKAEHHYETVYRVVVAALHYTHWPTLGLAVLAFAVMYGLKRFNPRLPFVLAAVAVTTLICWGLDLENNKRLPITAIMDEDARQRIREFNEAIASIEVMGERRAEVGRKLFEVKQAHGTWSETYLSLSHQQELLNLKISQMKEESSRLREDLRRLHLRGVDQGGQLALYPDTQRPAGLNHDGQRWRIKISNRKLDEQSLLFTGGVAVVGSIPSGLPAIRLPSPDLKSILQFLPMALIISLLGFMEAISIAKAMAAKTGQRLDPNQELIGQGLGNILGSLSQSYPTSGSFSRSAVNIGAGAVSGMSSVFTSLVVVITLLFFTPLLYHIPQSVLAAVIMMAVVGLLNVRGFVHAYRAQRYDGIIAIISFFSTLAFAPHLDRGIMVGVVLSIGHYLYRMSRPAVATLSLHPDFSFRDATRHRLRQCSRIAVVRFDGPLFFANTNYLEDQINDRVQQMPELKHILLPANGIVEIDGTGEEALSLIIDRLRNRGIDISFSGVNEQVLDLFRRTHLLEKIGEDHLFPTQAQAVKAIHVAAHEGSTETVCPLQKVCLEVVEPPKPGDYGILLVDDEAQFATYLSKRLRRRGMAVTVCLDPTEALSVMEQSYHEVILMDIRMPKLSGVDLLQEMRSRWPRVGVIMLTGHGTSEQAFEVGRMGAFDYLTKPCEVDQVIGVIHNTIIKVRLLAAEQEPLKRGEEPDARGRNF